MAGRVSVGGPEGIAPSTPTPLAARSNTATMTVSSARATSAPGIFGAYRLSSRTIRKALTPIATEYRLARGMDWTRAMTSTK